MRKARDVMTGMLITCSPDAPVDQVAQYMRDGNTGDVLITKDGKLVGIVTDRDIAIRVAAKGLNPSETPIHQHMSKHMVTGAPDWDLEKIAKTMGKHQIRRLPIVDRGLLVGIVSLGDVALRDTHDTHVANSLKQISEPSAVHAVRSKGRGRMLLPLGLGLVAGVVALTMSPKSFSSLRQRIQDSNIPYQILDILEEGRDRLSQMSA